MTFQKSIELANAYFKRNSNSAVACALDADTHWIFYGGTEKDIEIGGQGIKINKESGKLEEFILPDDNNFELLDKAIKIELC